MVVWMDTEGNVINMVRADRIQRAVLVGLDGNDTAYVCGSKPAGTAVCFDLGRDADSPLWSVELEPNEQHQCKGGAIASGRMYVSLYDEHVIALGEDETLGWIVNLQILIFPVTRQASVQLRGSPKRNKVSLSM